MEVRFENAAVNRAIGEARQTLADMRPVFQEIGEYLVESTKRRFRDSEAPDGSKWRAKSPHTIARYLASNDGLRPQPLIGPSGRLGKEIFSLATPNSVEVGSPLEYSGVMQGGAMRGAFGRSPTGRPIPWGDIPARPFIGLSDQDERSILTIVEEHLGRPLNGA